MVETKDIDVPELNEEKRDIAEAGRRKAEKKLKRQKRKEEKRLNKLLEEREAWEKLESDNKKIREENKKRRKLTDEKKKIDIQQTTYLIEQAKRLNEKRAIDAKKAAEGDEELNRLNEVKKKLADKKKLLEEKNRQADGKRLIEEMRKKAELAKAVEDIKRLNIQKRVEDEKRQDEEAKRLMSTKAFSSGNQRLIKTDESFTAIKRNTNAKAPATASVDIMKLVDSVKKQVPLALSKYPTQRQTIPTRPVFTPNNFINTAHHLPKPTTSTQQPTPVTTLTTFQPVIRNNPVSTTERQLVDPRIRQREAQFSQQEQQAPAFETVAIKRQISNSKDPRKNADNFKKIRLSNSTAFATPFVQDTLLYNGSKFIASVTVEGQQTCYHEAQMRKLILHEGKNEIRAKFTVPLKALNTILTGRPISFMKIIPKDHIIDLSKLKSYYQVNEMAGVVHHPDMKQAIVLLAEEDLKKLSNLTSDTGLTSTYSRLCAIFIDDLIERPKCLSKEIVYDLDSLDYSSPYTWNLAAEYLKFPEELNQLKNKARFLIYGQSDTSHMLTRANSALKNVQHATTSYVMMFDRYGEMFFSRNLTKHKKEAATRMWEFGVPDFSYSEMIPASEIFPNNSGGFVTTDMTNIASNPQIIESIHTEVGKLNSMPTVHGEWTFILPHNWLCHLRKTIMDDESERRAKEAIVSIAIGLSNDTIQILKLWCAETEEFNYVHFMDRVAHNKYKTHQYFVYVDDISSVSSSQYINSLEFVQSSKIYSTFA